MSRKPAYDDEDQLLLGEAAALLSVHPATLRRWADAGRVPVSRTPTNQRRFRVGDLRAVIVPEQRPADVAEGDEEDAPERVHVGAA